MNSLANLPTERQCHKQIFKAIYGVSGCPACAHRLLYRSNYAWCRVCRKKWSVKAACWLKQSNLSFRQHLAAHLVLAAAKRVLARQLTSLAEATRQYGAGLGDLENICRAALSSYLALLKLTKASSVNSALDRKLLLSVQLKETPGEYACRLSQIVLKTR